MARSRIGPRGPVERPTDLHPAIPFPPMEAELVRELPEGAEWQYEPKWDGFRGLLENGAGELRLWSRNARPLLRYFPELRPLEKLLPPLSALDGEIVIERDGVLDFDAMQTRLHPAESRIRKLSAEIPARFVAFDVLVWKGEEIWREPLAKRRTRLERFAKRFELSPATRDREEALGWLEKPGAFRRPNKQVHYFRGLAYEGLDDLPRMQLGVPDLVPADQLGGGHPKHRRDVGQAVAAHHPIEHASFARDLGIFVGHRHQERLAGSLIDAAGVQVLDGNPLILLALLGGPVGRRWSAAAYAASGTYM